LDLLEKEIVNGNGICWAICKSAPHPRQPRQHPTTQFFFTKRKVLPKPLGPGGTISVSVALSQTPAYPARPVYGALVSHGVPVLHPGFRQYQVI